MQVMVQNPCKGRCSAPKWRSFTDPTLSDESRSSKPQQAPGPLRRPPVPVSEAAGQVVVARPTSAATRSFCVGEAS